ncbi:uncharacterized protein LOC115100137 isoform X2 [Rhinatrema bivittatum]|uniref:uncharacterized protein LOC115100137 isoform X2 n=1 Tax=Rhinatrema bivittatum TaxID=194408 RepID=UPI00112AD743|nr:uncharacterized protein LOC115100137 isoform X2 [Rhinatrema bivittatum]
MSLNDKDSDCGEALEPPLSLWKMVEEHVPASERPEIKKILGEAAIDLSLELHAEVDTLLELWRELRRGTFSADQQLVPRGRPVLADPPVIKDMLKEEIRLLLLSVQQKAHSEGRDEDKAIAKYNSKVVHFVMGSSRPGSRMCRPRSVIGKHGGEDVPSRVCTASHGSDERLFPLHGLQLGRYPGSHQGEAERVFYPRGCGSSPICSGGGVPVPEETERILAGV